MTFSLGNKTGKGRITTTRHAKYVEEQPCGDGTHELVWRRGAIVCGGCGETWTDLDSELRGAE